MKGLGKFSQDASAVSPRRTYSLSGLFRRPSGNHRRATLDRASVTLGIGQVALRSIQQI